MKYETEPKEVRVSKLELWVTENKKALLRLKLIIDLVNELDKVSLMSIPYLSDSIKYLDMAIKEQEERLKEHKKELRLWKN